MLRREVREEGGRGRKRARKRGVKRMKRTRVRERDVMTQRKISNPLFFYLTFALLLCQRLHHITQF